MRNIETKENRAFVEVEAGESFNGAMSNCSFTCYTWVDIVRM